MTGLKLEDCPGLERLDRPGKSEGEQVGDALRKIDLVNKNVLQLDQVDGMWKLY